MTQDNWQPGTPPGGRRRTQHPTAENPFEEPEQSPELRQERSPDLYRATNPFWNQPFRDAESASAPPDLGEPPQSPPPEASVWSHPPVLDTDSYSEETQKRHHRTRRVWKAIVPLALAILFVAFLFGGVLTVRNIRVTGNVRISAEEIIPAVERALGILKERSELPLSWEDDVPRVIAQQCGGDVRKAVSACELLYEAADVTNGELLLKSEDALQVAQRSAMRYDKGGDAMYDCASALMKSLRGSDPDAALHYLARFLEAGDLVTPCRRLLCSASEDVGMAYPQAIAIVKACVDTAMQLGLPEAQLPLAQAAVLLATAPKSNSVIEGIGAAWADVKAGKSGNFPRCLQNVHADSTGGAQGQNYKYPHAYPNHWVKQQYLPDELKNVQYYRYGDNKVERAAAQYWEAIKG